MIQHHWPIRIYWEDTDAGGVVYHARYLHFLERARTEWLRGQGIEQTEMRDALDRVFAVQKVNVQFIKPAKLDDSLLVGSTLSECRRASFMVSHEIFRNDELILRATATIACLSASQFKPCAIPENLLTILQAGVIT